MAQTYTVKSGDTLSKIAKQFDVTVNELVQANQIANPNLIHPGQVLTIPGSNPTPASDAPLPTTGDAPLNSPLLPEAPPVRVPQFAIQFPKFKLHDPCAQDPTNLIRNGSMGPANHDVPLGTVSDEWTEFVLSGNVNFRWVDNEQIDPGGSQQLYSSDTFDAGIYQTVHGLEPGASYMIRWGYSLAAKSYNGPNVRVQTIGRKLGIDPYGGGDPRSPDIFWGPDFFDGVAALNRPELTSIFVASNPDITIFLRAMATDGSGGENRVWIDAICMEKRPEFPVVPVYTRPSKPNPSQPDQPGSITSPTTGDQPTYTVKGGDTLWKIAKQFGVTVDAIVQANNIANPNLIRVGQVLKIPKS